MRFFVLLLCGLCTVASAASAWAQDTVLNGYVTAVRGNSFDVMGTHVELTSTTAIREKEDDDTYVSRRQLGAVYLGEQMTVTGKVDRRTRTCKATQLDLLPNKAERVSGAGVIEAALPAEQAGLIRVVRADGYLLVLTPKTKLKLRDPLKTLADVRSNQWIVYHGVQGADGRVTVEEASVSDNVVKDGEEKLHEKNEFDAAAVDEGDRQSGVSRAFLGRDYKRLPVYKDAAMQARVERVGSSLVPAYQRQLAEKDTTRVDFRFEVVDTKDEHDAFALPSGIILVPYRVVDRLQSDSQLAAVLADNIAAVLEKQMYRLEAPFKTMTAANVAGLAGGVLVPGLGLATQTATGFKAESLLEESMRQSGRVSLWLMHDAGYDLTEAPTAWRLLNPKKAEPLEQTGVGMRAKNLYHALGTTWRSGDVQAALAGEGGRPSVPGEKASGCLGSRTLSGSCDCVWRERAPHLVQDDGLRLQDLSPEGSR